MNKPIRYLPLVLIGVTGLFGFSFHLEGNPEFTSWLAQFGATPASWLSLEWSLGDGLSATLNPNRAMASAFACCALGEEKVRRKGVRYRFC